VVKGGRVGDTHPVRARFRAENQADATGETVPLRRTATGWLMRGNERDPDV